jgi:hypothetical protein
MDVGDVRIVEKTLQWPRSQKEVQSFLGDPRFISSFQVLTWKRPGVTRTMFEEATSFSMGKVDFVLCRRLHTRLSSTLPMGNERIGDV